MQPRRPGVAALLAGHAAERLQAGRGPGVIAELAVQQQRGVEAAERGLVIALQVREHGRCRTAPARGMRAARWAVGDGLVHPLPHLVVVAAQVRVPAELADDPQRGHGVAAAARVLRGGPQVGLLLVEPVELRLELARRGVLHLGARLLGEPGVVGQVGVACLVPLPRLASFSAAYSRIVASS